MLPTRAAAGRSSGARLVLFLRSRGVRAFSTSQGSTSGGEAASDGVASRLARREKRLQEQLSGASKDANKAAAAGTAAAGEGSSFGAGRIAGLCALGVTGYALYKASEEGSEMRTWAEARQAGEDGPTFSESLDQYLRGSVVGGAYVSLYDTFAKPFIQPSREKLLPDWHSIPNIPPDAPCPPTLVIDLEDTLVHATWDPKFGWRYVKRPGVDRFLQDLSKYYEIVLFSPSNFSVVEPVVYSLDKTGLILHRLYKDSTRFHRGKHVKDLCNLNRDLRTVVIVDDDPDAFQFQPGNGIRIKPFTDINDKSDRSLDKLRKFLLALVMEGVSDFPAVLRRFKGMDADQIAEEYEHLLYEAKVRQAQQHSKGLGGLLRSAKPLAGSKESSGVRLTGKDIASGTMPSSDKAEPPPSGPTKTGRYWKAYQAHLKEMEEDQRRKMELWAKQQSKREEERRRQAMEAMGAGEG